MSIGIGIYGASGYTGLELIRLIRQHPAFELRFATSDSFAGQSYLGTSFIKPEAAELGGVELVFLCTPHGASAPLAAQVLAAGPKVIDLSADLRLRSPEAYERWYDHPHPAPDLLPAVYGLPEYYRAEIAGERVIANPGCYPTTTLLALLPLLRGEAVQPGAPLIVDAKSGVSGAGRKPSLGTHFVEVYGDFKPYNIGRVHRHTGEIEQELRANADFELGPLIFSPHLLPIDRGLLATCYVPLAEGWTFEGARALVEGQYEDEPLVEVLPDGETARIAAVSRQNGAQISLHRATENMLIVVCALDNLLKGASSQALQNANLLCGLEETAGLV